MTREKRVIMAIETSCDETAIAIVRGMGGLEHPRFEIAAHVVLSQVALHAQYGGVFPMMAKREHAKNLVPVLQKVLRDAGVRETNGAQSNISSMEIRAVLAREESLADSLMPLLSQSENPNIDMIAVTNGPGLEPTLWVGINFAKALACAWSTSRQIPLIGTNHMEGHLLSALLSSVGEKTREIAPFGFPLIGLLVSGGHTELVLMKDWFVYERVGETRDDAAGEAFDKVARMLSLPYPGGPEIAKLAADPRAGEEARQLGITLPRPMIDSGDFDFSFSGLKTAVLYLVKKIGALDDTHRRGIAYEFENAVVEVLVTKTIEAAKKYGAQTITLGGGVSANTRLRETLQKKVAEKLPNAECRLSPADVSGDNAIMIAVAAYLRSAAGIPQLTEEIIADGNLRLA